MQPCLALQRSLEGRNVILTVMPNEEPGMGRQLLLWFTFPVVIAQFGVYIASRTLPAGTDCLQVFRVVDATSLSGSAIRRPQPGPGAKGRCARTVTKLE